MDEIFRRFIEKTKVRRAALVASLGGQCVMCGAVEKLDIHHLGVRLWKAAELARWQRVRWYEQEARDGEVVLLCRPCHIDVGRGVLRVEERIEVRV